MKDTNTFAIAIGVVTPIIMLAVTFIVYHFGLHSGFFIVTYAIMFVGIFLNSVIFSRSNDGFVTFGNVFASCFKTTIIITLVMICASIPLLIAHPDRKEKHLAKARAKMESEHKLTDERIATRMESREKNYYPFFFAGVVIENLFPGLIFSLVAAAVVKKKGRHPAMT